MADFTIDRCEGQYIVRLNGVRVATMNSLVGAKREVAWRKQKLAEKPRLANSGEK